MEVSLDYPLYVQAEQYVRAIQDYKTQDGVVHGVRFPQEPATSGNHHVINATHLGILIRFKEAMVLNGLDTSVVDNELEKHTEATRKFIAETQRVSTAPFFSRHPTKMLDKQSHDDYLAIAMISSRNLYAVNASLINNVGQVGVKGSLSIPVLGKERILPLIKPKLKYYFDVQNLNMSDVIYWRNWHGKFVWLRPLYKIAAKDGSNVSWLERLSYCFYLLNVDKNLASTSGKILRWLSIFISEKDKSTLFNLCIEEFYDKINEQYEGGMSDVFGIYYGKDHPFSLYTKGLLRQP